MKDDEFLLKYDYLWIKTHHLYIKTQPPLVHQPSEVPVSKDIVVSPFDCNHYPPPDLVRFSINFHYFSLFSIDFLLISSLFYDYRRRMAIKSSTRHGLHCTSRGMGETVPTTRFHVLQSAKESEFSIENAEVLENFPLQMMISIEKTAISCCNWHSLAGLQLEPVAVRLRDPFA